MDAERGCLRYIALLHLPYHRMFHRYCFLRMMKTRTFFVISVVMMALSMIGMWVGESKTMLYIAIALVGYGNSNVFSMISLRHF